MLEDACSCSMLLKLAGFYSSFRLFQNYSCACTYPKGTSNKMHLRSTNAVSSTQAIVLNKVLIAPDPLQTNPLSSITSRIRLYSGTYVSVSKHAHPIPIIPLPLSTQPSDPNANRQKTNRHQTGQSWCVAATWRFQPAQTLSIRVNHPRIRSKHTETFKTTYTT